MAKGKNDTKDEAPVKKKAKTKLGKWLEARSEKKKEKKLNEAPKPLSKDKQLELDKIAAEKLRVDVLAVTGLKNQLLALGLAVPKLINDALTSPASQAKADEALKARDAVNAFIRDLALLTQSRDKAGLLKFGSHPLITKFTDGLDHINKVATKRWEGAATAAEAATHAEFMKVQTEGLVGKRELVHAELDKTDKAITKAEQALLKVSGLGTVDVSVASGKIKTARGLFTVAADSKDLPAVLLAMEGWEKDISEATEGEGESLGKFSDYRKLRVDIVDQVGKASVLRGGTEDGTELFKRLKLANSAIGFADDVVSKAQDPATIKQAIKALNVHKDLLKEAKVLAAKAKTQSEEDLKALPKYQEALAALKRMREKLAGMPGAGEQVRQADIALAAAQLGSNGQPPGGYAKALEGLKGKPEALLQQAEMASQNLVKLRKGKYPGLPEVQQRAESVLVKLMNVSPVAQAGVYQEALAKAIEQDDPVTALNNLMLKWNTAIEEQRKIDQQLFTHRKRMGELTTQLEKLNAPKEVMDGLRNTEAVDRLREGNEYERALVVAERATKAAEDYLLVAEEQNRQWAKELEQLAAIRVEARRWMAWPPLKVEATNIEGDAERIRQAVAKGEDLGEAIKAAQRLMSRVEQLQMRAAEQNLDHGVDLTGYGEQIKEAQKKWVQGLAPVKQALAKLTESLKNAGAKDSAENTSWHQQLAKLEEKFEQALGKPMLSKGQTPQQELDDTLALFLKEAENIGEGATKALSDTGQLAQLGETAKGQDQDKELRALHAKLTEMIVTLETSGRKVEVFWGMLGRTYDPKTAPGLEAKWRELEGDLKLARESRIEELTRKRVEGLKKADALDKTLTRLLSKNQVRFPGFFEDLRGRALDARGMLETNDATLMAAGMRQIEELTKAIGEAREGGETEGGQGLKTFDDVADKWKELSNLVGTEVLMARTPATYARLYGELKAVTEKSKSMPPDEGWKLLDALRLPIANALAQAELVRERYLIFKARQEQIEEKFTELHKLTKTWVTEKTDAYNDKFKTRMASAKQMAKQEGQMDAAFKMLDAIQSELTKLMANPGTAREELQKLDAAAADEQRELRDMAREWVATQVYWSDRLLPKVEKAMTARGEEDQTEYKDLKDAVSRTSKPLKAYLDIISKLPHEYAATNSAPDIEEARKAFTSARMRLMQMQKVADRLISGGGTTNVNLENDLGKLEEEWINRVRKVNGAFGRLAEKLSALPDQAGTDPTNEETWLEPKALGKLKTATNVLSRSIPASAARFSESAFSASLAVLRSPTSTPANRKTAREDALRTMRLLRDEVVSSELFRKLFEGAASGTLDVDVRPDLGLLRASLKKIELAVLVAA